MQRKLYLSERRCFPVTICFAFVHVFVNSGTGTGALSTSITEEHEKLLRRSKNNLVEMWYAFERQLNDVKNNPNSVADKSDKFKANFATQLQ